MEPLEIDSSDKEDEEDEEDGDDEDDGDDGDDAISTSTDCAPCRSKFFRSTAAVGAEGSTQYTRALSRPPHKENIGYRCYRVNMMSL